MTIEASFAFPSHFDLFYRAFVMYANETLHLKAWLIKRTVTTTVEVIPSPSLL